MQVLRFLFYLAVIPAIVVVMTILAEPNSYGFQVIDNNNETLLVTIPIYVNQKLPFQKSCDWKLAPNEKDKDVS